LKVRPEADLAFIETASIRSPKLLYDTTVYIDILQNRFPQNGEPTLRAAEAWHSPVSEAELAAAIGLLDPAHPQTPEITEQISSVIGRRPAYRTIAPTLRSGGKLGSCRAFSRVCKDMARAIGDEPGMMLCYLRPPASTGARF
jgi:hypothetical protein